jgi:hypothetical protein
LSQRRRWPEDVYAKAQEILDDDPKVSSKTLAAELDEHFGGDAPAATTIRDWLRSEVIKPRRPSDLWTVAAASADERGSSCQRSPS